MPTDDVICQRMTTHITDKFNEIVNSLMARGYNVKVESKSDELLGDSTTAQVSASDRSAHVYLAVTITSPSGSGIGRKRSSIRTFGRVTQLSVVPNGVNRQKQVNYNTALWWLDHLSRNSVNVFPNALKTVTVECR